MDFQLGEKTTPEFYFSHRQKLFESSAFRI